MQQLGPMEVRVVHEFERPQVAEMTENQRRLQLDMLRFERARRPGLIVQLRLWLARQAAALRRRVALPAAPQRQAAAGDC